jgi:hypothetical protein
MIGPFCMRSNISRSPGFTGHHDLPIACLPARPAGRPLRRPLPFPCAGAVPSAELLADESLVMSAEPEESLLVIAEAGESLLMTAELDESLLMTEALFKH